MVLTNRWLAAGVVASLALTNAPAVAGPEPGSADMVKQLASAMTEQKLEVIATADPEHPSRFVAAMLIPGAQLLLVTADYPNPAELQALVGQHDYRNVYSALHQPSAQPTRLFFLDAGCDGVKIGRDSVDVLYEKGTNQIVFDGDWKKSKLSESEYSDKVQQAGKQYARLVSLLRDSLAPAVASR